MMWTHPKILGQEKEPDTSNSWTESKARLRADGRYLGEIGKVKETFCTFREISIL